MLKSFLRSYSSMVRSMATHGEDWTKREWNVGEKLMRAFDK
jgi:hypothetical protein